MDFNDNDIVEISTFLLSFLKSLSPVAWKLLICYLRKINPLEITSDRNITDKSYPYAAQVEIPVTEFCQLYGTKYGSDYSRALKKSIDELSEIKIAGTDPTKGIKYAYMRPFPFLCIVNIAGKEQIVFKPLPYAIPLFFNLNLFIKSSANNFVALSSTNQILMVFWLEEQFFHKRYDCEVSIEELKSYLGIDSDAYSLFGNFKSAVLDVCQDAINKHTDLCFTYEKGKLGAHGKVYTLIFHINRKKYLPQKPTQACLPDITEHTDTANQERISQLEQLCKEMLERNRLNGVEHKFIREWVRIFENANIEDLVMFAFEDNSFHGDKLSMNHIHRTLIKWHEKNIKTVEEAEAFCKKEHEVNKRNAARKRVANTSWRTGEEAGIGCKDTPLLPKKAPDTVNPVQFNPDDNDGIPEDILDMFGDNG